MPTASNHIRTHVVVRWTLPRSMLPAMREAVAVDRAIRVATGQSINQAGRPSVIADGLARTGLARRRQCKRLGLDYDAIVAGVGAEKPHTIKPTKIFGPDIDS